MIVTWINFVMDMIGDIFSFMRTTVIIDIPYGPKISVMTFLMTLVVLEILAIILGRLFGITEGSIPTRFFETRAKTGVERVKAQRRKSRMINDRRSYSIDRKHVTMPGRKK